MFRILKKRRTGKFFFKRLETRPRVLVDDYPEPHRTPISFPIYSRPLPTPLFPGVDPVRIVSTRVSMDRFRRSRPGVPVTVGPVVSVRVEHEGGGRTRYRLPSTLKDLTQNTKLTHFIVKGKFCFGDSYKNCRYRSRRFLCTYPRTFVRPSVLRQTGRERTILYLAPKILGFVSNEVRDCCGVVPLVVLGLSNGVETGYEELWEIWTGHRRIRGGVFV